MNLDSIIYILREILEKVKQGGGGGGGLTPEEKENIAKIPSMEEDLKKAKAIYDDYINSQNLM